MTPRRVQASEVVRVHTQAEWTRVLCDPRSRDVAPSAADREPGRRDQPADRGSTVTCPPGCVTAIAVSTTPRAQCAEVFKIALIYRKIKISFLGTSGHVVPRRRTGDRTGQKRPRRPPVPRVWMHRHRQLGVPAPPHPQISTGQTP